MWFSWKSYWPLELTLRDTVHTDWQIYESLCTTIFPSRLWYVCQRFIRDERRILHNEELVLGSISQTVKLWVSLRINVSIHMFFHLVSSFSSDRHFHSGMTFSCIPLKYRCIPSLDTLRLTGWSRRIDHDFLRSMLALDLKYKMSISFHLRPDSKKSKT